MAKSSQPSARASRATPGFRVKSGRSGMPRVPRINNMGKGGMAPSMRTGRSRTQP